MARSLLLVLLLAAPLLAAPVPPDEKPKPRAKLLGTVKLNKHVTEVCWTPDAKYLIVATNEKGFVIDRDQLGEDTPAKPIAEFVMPTGGMTKLGVTPDSTEVYAILTAGRINSETRLCYWTLKDLLDGKKKAKPDRAVSLEVDNPTNQFAFSADGKSLFVVMSEPRPGMAVQPNGQPAQIGKVLRLSTKTGDVAEEWLPLELPNATLIGAVVHPGSGKVFAHFQSAEEHVVHCFDRAGKKEKWERTFSQPSPNAPVGYGPKVSPDGQVVVATWSRQFLIPQPGVVLQPGQQAQLMAVNTVSPQLLHATTGDVIADLGGDDVYHSHVFGFSTDSKLMYGMLYRATGSQLLVWETKSGKPLKTWHRGSGDLLGQFAPNRHELTIVERSQIQVMGTQESLERMRGGLLTEVEVGQPQIFTGYQLNQPQAQVIRIDHTAIIGVWDLAPLVK